VSDDDGIDQEPVIETSIRLPFGYALTARARPSTVRRTIVRLLPWAIYLAMPPGRASKAAYFVAARVSPLVKQRIK
jgi:hypothetical protein